MDRQIEYPGEILTEVELLTIQRNIYTALSYLAQAVVGLGTTQVADGFACTPAAAPNLTVQVGPGALYSQQYRDATAYSTLAADNVNLIVKQGLNLGTAGLGYTVFGCPAPATASQSINYLVEVAFSEGDATSLLLQYFNSVNPATAWSGPNNTGASQNTQRIDGVTIQIKSGVAASAGTQTTPAPDSGFVGLWVVTVQNGQTAIGTSNIAAYPGSPLINPNYKLNILPSTMQSQPSNYSADTGTANNYAVTLNPVPASWASLIGAPIRWKVANSNTSGTCYLNANGLGNKALINSDGSPISPGSLIVGGVVEGVFDGNNVEMARSAGVQLAQCRLSYTTSTTVTLAPFGGNRLLNPASGTQTVPSAGIVATSTNCYLNGTAGQALSSSTTYWIYEFSNGGTPAVDFCTTTWVVDAVTGMPIKTGDNTRVLVGRCTTNSSAQFAAGRVLSFWNRRSIGTQMNSSGSTSSLTYTATTTSITVDCWGDEGVSISVNAQGANSTSGNGGGIQPWVDGLGLGAVASGASIGASALFSAACTWAGTLSEGSHVIAMATAVYIGGTFSWNNSNVSVVKRG